MGQSILTMEKKNKFETRTKNRINKNRDRLQETLKIYRRFIRHELKGLLTSGWSQRERETDWKNYLEDEVKPYYPRIYQIFKESKGVIENEKRIK